MLSLLSFIFAFSTNSDCIRPTLAYRTGTENCWARFELNSTHRICLSYSLWQEWLKTPMPPKICADSLVKWKATSHLDNSVHHPSPALKNIHYTQFLRQFSNSQDTPSSFYSQILQRIEQVRERTSHLLTPFDPTGIARLLILRESKPASTANIFRKLGFVHLLSASGIHLYAIAQIWSTILCNLCLYLRIPVRLGLGLNRISHFGFCFLVWILNGGHLGMLRPWAILLLREGARTLGFRWKKLSPLFLALSLDLIFVFVRKAIGLDSSLTFQSGRWVYALAVGGGLIWCESFRWTHLGLAVGSWIGVAIWEVTQSGSVSLATPIISLITLPVTCLSVYPLILCCILLNEIGLQGVAQVSCQHLLQGMNLFIFYLTKLALLPGNLWAVTSWTILPASLFAFITGIVRPLKFKISWILLCSLLSLGIRSSNSARRDYHIPYAQKIEQLDVGQGDSALIKGSTFGLIDTGSERVLSLHQWLEIFLERGIHQIDWIALSHLDEDHSGGLLKIASLLSIQCIVAPEAELNSFRGKKLNHQLSHLGIQVKQWDSPCIPYAHFSVENKLKSKLRASRNENMGALFIPIENGGFYLSAGDANSKDEMRIAHWLSHLPAHPINHTRGPRILKVSHHGSRHSSPEAFLKIIQPTEAWISVGRQNGYGHPSIEVLNRISQQRVIIRRTDRDGSLIIKGGAPRRPQTHLQLPKKSLH